MPVTQTESPRPWTVPASEIAEAAGLPLKFWRKEIGRTIKGPQLRHGRLYTDLVLLIAETTSEVSVRFGGRARVLADRTLVTLLPRLVEAWERTKRGDAVPVEVIVRFNDPEEIILQFKLGAIARTLARIAGDRRIIDESLRDLRDVVLQQRTDGTYDRLEAAAAQAAKESADRG